MSGVATARILWAFNVYIAVSEGLTTEGTHKFKLLEFGSIFINESRPFIHFILGNFIELILKVVIFLFEFLGKLPNNVILEL